MSETLSLWGLFASSFLAATLLPGGSEAVLIAVLGTHPRLCWFALLVATIGNTLGGISSYWIGRSVPQRRRLKGLDQVRQYGAPVLLLSWVPIMGDAFCLAAGWVRLNAWRSALAMAAGKFGRYLAIAAVVT